MAAVCHILKNESSLRKLDKAGEVVMVRLVGEEDQEAEVEVQFLGAVMSATTAMRKVITPENAGRKEWIVDSVVKELIPGLLRDDVSSVISLVTRKSTVQREDEAIKAVEVVSMVMTDADLVLHILEAVPEGDPEVSQDLPLEDQNTRKKRKFTESQAQNTHLRALAVEQT